VEIFFAKPGGLELAGRQGQRLNFAELFLLAYIVPIKKRLNEKKDS